LALLQVGFTKLPQSLGVLVSSCLTFSPLPREMAVTPFSRGGILSVALSLPCPVKWRLSLFHRADQSALRTTLPCGARTFLPSLTSHQRDVMRGDHLFPFDSPLLLFLLRSSSESPDWPNGLPLGSVLLGWI
jgi:hypothetical protein